MTSQNLILAHKKDLAEEEEVQDTTGKGLTDPRSLRAGPHYGGWEELGLPTGLGMGSGHLQWSVQRSPSKD